MDAVLEVAGGRLGGERRDGVWRFLGVPYAGSPAGARRWRPPGPVDPWDGVRPAVTPGPLAPQTPPAPGMSVPGDPTDQDEDCLHLSLWTPALDDGRRPVMVWMHGGGFTTGTAGAVLYDGTGLAARGDVVVVTVNYRLGALGFLGHPALAGDDGGYANWGLLDQVAALRWVRDHISMFGGDPARVTVFGESAGAMGIASLLAMPAARGLFHRAVLQSGPPYAFSAGRGADAAAEVVRELGMGEVRRDLLESVPAADLVDAVAAMQSRLPRPGELTLPLLPVIDGVSLPHHPLEAVAAGSAAGVALIVGTNRDELGFFVFTDTAMMTMDEEELLVRLARSAPEADPARVVAHYRSARARRAEPVAPKDLWIAAGSDLVFRWPTLRFAAAQHHHDPRTFVYLFTWETPVFGGALGACHALEIPFVFMTVRNPAVAVFSGGGPAAEALSDTMAAAWVAFARTGDPTAEPGGSWPAWDPAGGRTMVLGATSGIEAFARYEELAVWEEIYPMAGASAGPAGGVASG